MRTALLLLGLLASCVTFAGARAQETDVKTVYTVRQTGGGLGMLIDQIVIFQVVKRGAETVWVAEERRHESRMGRETYQHRWIDGRSCSALAGVLADIGRIPVAKFAAPDEKSGGWISDTPYVTLMGPSVGGQWGAVLFQRDLGGGVSRWWSASDQALTPCWQAQMVMVGGGSVFPKLGSDEEAAAAGRP